MRQPDKDLEDAKGGPTPAAVLTRHDPYLDPFYHIQARLLMPDVTAFNDAVSAGR